MKTWKTKRKSGKKKEAEEYFLTLTVTCVVYLKPNTFWSVKSLSRYGPEINRVAAWYGHDWYRSWVEETLYFFWIVFVIWKRLIKDNTLKEQELINHEKLSVNYFL